MQPGEGTGLIEPAPNATLTSRKHRRMNLKAICLNIFLPWFLFSALYMCISFSFHYDHPTAMWGIIVLAWVLVTVLGVLAFAERKSERHPTWYMFTTVAFAMAVLLAMILGNMNFSCHMKSFYDIENLNTYPSVDPSHDRGQEFMDAGRIYFAHDSVLDMSKAICFKNSDIYCAVPIVKGDHEIGFYDFWAVGMNCCNGASGDFRCGEFNNPHAHSGLRLVDSDQRLFYRLAVQRAEAAYNIKTTHPIFFHWVQDPIAETDISRMNGCKHFLISSFSYFAFNSFCVLVATVIFSKNVHQY